MQISAVGGDSRWQVRAASSSLQAARVRLAADQAAGADGLVIQADQAAVAAGQLQVAQSRRGLVLDVSA